MGPLPVNFEAKLKEPKAINGGYPYSIKAEDLMKNFVDAKLEVDDSIHSSGLQLEEYTAYGDNGHKGRAIRIDPDSVLIQDHPWKVTKASDSSVSVGMGRILTMRNEIGLELSSHPKWVRLGQAAKFNGGNVEGIAASGYIYGYIPKRTYGEEMFFRDDSTTLQIDRTMPNGAITVAFSATLPEKTEGEESPDEFCFVIAEVEVTEGVLTVTEQILTHNPTMWHIDLPPSVEI